MDKYMEKCVGKVYGKAYGKRYMDKYMEKVDGPNWSYQANAGEESGLAATVATGLTCPVTSINGKVFGKVMEDVYGKVYEKEYGHEYGKSDGPNWSHQPNASEESGLATTVATGQYMGSIWKSQYM